MTSLTEHYTPNPDANPLLIRREGNGTLRLTMNRPAVHNAFDDAQIDRMTEAIRGAHKDRGVRLVILGSTGRTFCAGGDLNYMRQVGTLSYEANLADAGQLAELFRLIATLPQPTIARVQGAAFGGGVGLLSCCDYAVGNGYVKMALSEVKLGIAPATIGPYVVRTVGEKQARRLFVSGEMIRADRAHQLGFLSDLVDAEQLDNRIDELSATILANGPAAIRACKRLAGEVAHGPVTPEMIAKTVKQIADMRHSAEGREGMSAFLEKRKPEW